MSLACPVILVPGITATSLRDEYALPAETLWSMSILSTTKEYERIALHPDDLRYETIEPARVVADQVLEVAYKELIEELRHNLSEDPERSVPVYAFAYDWRMPLEISEARLVRFMDEVIARTKLLRHYQNDPWIKNPRVNLVGHSMGGLLITDCLARYVEHKKVMPPVAKVATLATPYRGSFEAVIQFATGTASLGTGAPSSRERETARVTPALYYLIPSCAGLTLMDRPSDTTLFKPDLWQPSIVQSLAQYVRLYAAQPEGAADQAATLFRAMLDKASSHRAQVDSFELATAGLGADDWLCVAGANSETRVALNVVKEGGGYQFDFRSSDRKNEWSEGAAVQSELTGDGTVPFAAARPAFIAPERLVCVTPDDYGYWEVQDRVVSAAAGFHGILPNMDMLHRLLVRFFTGRPDTRKNTWGRRAPGVPKGKWNPPLALSEES